MAAGDPTGEDLCSGTTSIDTLPTNPNWELREISLGDGTSLVAGTTYAIVARSNYTGLGGAMWGWADAGVTGDPYKSTNSGASWTKLSNKDFIYQTSGGESFTGSPSIGGDLDPWDWYAQTFVATSSYTITSVNLYLNRYYGFETGTVTASIRATVPAAPSKATTPIPTNAATDITLDQATIAWTAGSGATSHDVYYGTTSGNLTLVSDGQAGTSFTITGITNGSPFNYLITRYWRIDEVNDAGTTTGDEWSFTTIRFAPPTPTYWYSVGNYYYRLLIQSDGSYGNPPPVGVEDTDYVVVTYLPNFIRTQRKLISCANNKVWYEAT